MLFKPAFPLLSIFILICLASYSQQENEISNQYWVDVIPHFRISDSFEFYGDGSFRVGDEGSRKIYTIRPSIKFQTTPIVSFHLGLGLFYNHFNETENYFELRPSEGIRLSWPDIGSLHFKHYLRFEQRYFSNNKEDNFFLHRSRYKIKAKVPLNKKVVQEGAIYIPFSFELLGTADEEISIVWVSESRLMLGIGYSFNEKWIVEFEYMYWWSKNLPSDVFEPSTQVFRLKFIKDGWLLGE
jgi:hypothetical protein